MFKLSRRTVAAPEGIRDPHSIQSNIEQWKPLLDTSSQLASALLRALKESSIGACAQKYSDAMNAPLLDPSIGRGQLLDHLRRQSEESSLGTCVQRYLKMRDAQACPLTAEDVERHPKEHFRRIEDEGRRERARRHIEDAQRQREIGDALLFIAEETRRVAKQAAASENLETTILETSNVDNTVATETPTKRAVVIARLMPEYPDIEMILRSSNRKPWLQPAKAPGHEGWYMTKLRAALEKNVPRNLTPENSQGVLNRYMSNKAGASR